MPEQPEQPEQPDLPAQFVHDAPGADHPELGGRIVACTCHGGQRG